ncbi:hypothetical protein GPALN_012679 [Globodera pallida]|nr:hypothetical protein GPALN_012679 [Globodera pallida]
MHKKCEEIKAQAIHALKALQDYGEQKSRKMLFPETDAAVFLAVKYKKVPLARGTSLRKFIALPYSDRNPLNTSICLILPDRNRSAAAAKDPDVDGQAREWAELLRDKYALTGKHIAKIFTLTQLKREYGRQADKAKLANTYDIFMVDRKLMKMALFFLGSSFKKATKMPLPIDSSVDMSKKLNESFSLVQLHLAPLKDAVTLRIGNLGQPLNELESNFNAIIEAIFTHFPGGSLNIRSCHLQTAATKVSLPIFVDFGPANEVRLEMPKKQQLAVEVDGCSTLPDGLMVKVRADGKVIVVEEKTGDEVLYPTGQDEWEHNDDIRPLTGDALQKMLRKKANRLVNERRQKDVKEEEKAPHEGVDGVKDDDDDGTASNGKKMEIVPGHEKGTKPKEVERSSRKRRRNSERDDGGLEDEKVC